jgi:8-oxo-dGTP diphosphatase
MLVTVVAVSGHSVRACQGDRLAASPLECLVVSFQHLRLAAYAVCLDDDNRMLLARSLSPDRAQQHWTLPGGGVEHGEDPFDAVVREVGGFVDVQRLLGVDSRTRRVERAGEFHDVGFFYSGVAHAEVAQKAPEGTSWVALKELAEQERSVIVEVALELHRTMPSTGHVSPLAVEGLLRH